MFTHPFISEYLSVAFAVSLSNYYSYEGFQAVKFEHVLSNRGNGYVYDVTIISAFPLSRVLSFIKSIFALVSLTIMIFYLDYWYLRTKQRLQ